jgi:malic enzyme
MMLPASPNPPPSPCSVHGDALCLADNGRGEDAAWPLCRYIFPGLALGAFMGQTKTISDHMVMAAAEALPKMLTLDDHRRRAVYPNLADIREISIHVALEVIKAAAEDDMVSGPAAVKLMKGDDALRKHIRKHMYKPVYKSIVFLERGVNE